MSRLYNESGHAGQDDRNEEAERIIEELVEKVDSLAPNELTFVNDMNRKKQDGTLYCSVRQLFWLRDLYGKYCV